MRNKTRLFLNFISRNKLWSTVVIIIFIISGWYYFNNSAENTNYTIIPVSLGSVSEIVSVTGNVKPLSAVDLAFERGGRISNINIKVGDSVKTGQTLASVSNSDLAANLEQAQANLKKALAQYQNTKNGTRPEEITLQETQVEKSVLDLTQSKVLLVNALQDSYTKASDALTNKVYSLFTDPIKYRAVLSFSTDAFLKEDIEEGKDDLSDNFYLWRKSLDTLNSGSDLEKYYQTAKTNLFALKDLLDNCATAVNSLDDYSSGISQTQIDTWKANISAARISINLAIDSLTAAFNSYNRAASGLKISQDQLAVVKAGATSNEVLSAEASYEAAQAGVSSAAAELAKSVIRAPIDGVVTNIKPELGEIVTANVNVLSIISYGDYEVEAFIPEADISKVKVGDLASTTLDAYGSGVNFETSVTKIDPAATVIDGVPTYKVTFKFNNQDDRVRSGMTANLDILTNHKDRVIIIPSRLVISKDDGKYVPVLNINNPSKIIETKIILGIRGDDGMVEVVSGLKITDKIATPNI